jgi:MFS family permease
MFSLAVIGNIAAQAARLGAYSYIAAIFAQRYDIQGADLGTVGIIAGTGSFAGAVIATSSASWWSRRGWPVLGLSVVSTSIMSVGIAMLMLPASLPMNLIGLGISFAAGITIFGAGQVYLTSTFVSDRTVISWNSSPMYIGAAIGTVALGLTNLNTVAFAIVSLTFVAIAAASYSTSIRISHQKASLQRRFASQDFGPLPGATVKAPTSLGRFPTRPETVRSYEPQADSRPVTDSTVGGRSARWACGFARRSGRRISSRSLAVISPRSSTREVTLRPPDRAWRAIEVAAS